MKRAHRTTCVAIVAASISAGGLLACVTISTSTPNSDGGVAPGGGVTPGADGSTVVADDGSTVVDNDGGAGASGDSATGDSATPHRKVGSINVGQGDLAGNFNYSASASFVDFAPSTATPPPCPQAVSVTLGACTAAVICIPPASDAGPPAYQALNAGAITIGGGSGDAGALVLSYGPIPGAKPPQTGYAGLSGNAQVFAGGDVITAAGAGGPDLPAFTAATVVAPNDIALTGPGGCGTTGCPDLDRTVDQTVTWSGGGAGKVFVTYETLSATLVTIVSCDFDASAGTGTIPSSLLANLEMGSGTATVTGIFGVGPTNESASFLVGDIPSTVKLQAAGFSGSLTISK